MGQPYMENAIDLLRNEYNIHILQPNGWDESEINKYVAECTEKNIVGVCGFAQKDALHHLIINEKLGNKSISPLALLICFNKFLQREQETTPNWYTDINPEDKSDDDLIAKIKEWPYILKNTSLSLGKGVFFCKDAENMQEILAEYRGDKELIAEIKRVISAITTRIPQSDMPNMVPSFVAEHAIDMNKQIEYCYEGCVLGDGSLVHYGFTEEVYFKNHSALGYITPPVNFPSSKASLVEEYMSDYMEKLIAKGYKQQFFNTEIWFDPAKEGNWSFCEINPRCAHSYHYNYLYCYGTQLFRDNIELAVFGRAPKVTPWQLWKEGKGRVTLIVLITTKTPGTVQDILNYDYIEHLEKVEKILIRHNKKPDDVLTAKDMTTAGVMCLQMWVVADDHKSVATKEAEIRQKIYKVLQEGNDYPQYWMELSQKKVDIGLKNPIDESPKI